MTYPAATALDLVRQATVRITSKRRTGTGFVVDRNIVLTCAHVPSRRSDDVQIQAQGQRVTGVVLKRLPESGRSDGGAYPFPGIAFIGVDGNLDLPVVETHSLLLPRWSRAAASSALSPSLSAGGAAPPGIGGY